MKHNGIDESKLTHAESFEANFGIPIPEDERETFNKQVDAIIEAIDNGKAVDMRPIYDRFGL